MRDKNKKQIIALMYDFDKTLCGKDMQDYSFIPSIGMNSNEFWQEADRIARKNNMDKILAYMYLMIKTAKRNDVPITKSAFTNLGKEVVLLRGVKTWFERINEYGRSLGVEIEHYILSSGLSEIIEGTPIASYFKKIYACQFHYNERGNADWPQQAVNYTTKTQFLFRISKGVLDVMDDVTLNSSIAEEDRRVPYHNMIYIGDGLTDVPCMSLVKERGGESIAIYHKNQKLKVKQLITEGRVNYICPADYSLNTPIDNIVKKIINKMVVKQELINIHLDQMDDICGDDLDE